MLKQTQPFDTRHVIGQERGQGEKDCKTFVESLSKTTTRGRTTSGTIGVSKKENHDGKTVHGPENQGESSSKWSVAHKKKGRNKVTLRRRLTEKNESKNCKAGPALRKKQETTSDLEVRTELLLALLMRGALSRR